MYINPIKLTNYNNNNINAYKQMSFRAESAPTTTTPVDTTPTADTAQFNSSTATKDKAKNNKSLAHRLYRTLTSTIQNGVDPYFPVNETSRSFLY